GSFAISYITPGPQFGGEPFQVIQIEKRHNVPLAAATASVTIEKVLMLFTNLLFLVPGIFLVVQNQLFTSADLAWGLAPAFAAFGLLAALMLAWGTGRQPLGKIFGRWWPNWWLSQEIINTEAEIGAFCLNHPRAILVAAGWASLNWVLLAFEYWLMARFLGIEVSWVQGLMMLTVFRLALLMPIPAGLGAVEGGHVWILGAMGFTPAAELALSLSLLIRLRDIILTAVGLWWAGSLRSEN
ncbi:MAG: lysylphosphatidylglycerol synthase transmembrane domain-containing protein, partial [Chloroflexota bacterium]